MSAKVQFFTKGQNIRTDAQMQNAAVIRRETFATSPKVLAFFCVSL